MSLPNNTTSLNALLSAVNALPEKIDTSGTAVAADIYAGKTATVNDVRLTGSNPYNAANVEPAVANALAELAEKGVDTSGKGLADIAGLIASIEAGGGGNVAWGTFTLASSTKEYVITHGLGVVPDVFIYWMGNQKVSGLEVGDTFFGVNTTKEYTSLTGATSPGASVIMLGTGTSTSTARYMTSSYANITSNPDGTIAMAYGAPCKATDTTVTLADETERYKLVSGFVYVWIAIGGLA